MGTLRTFGAWVTLGTCRPGFSQWSLWAFGAWIALRSLRSGFALRSLWPWWSRLAFRSLRASGSVSTRGAFIARKRKQSNRAGSQRLARIQRGALDAHFQIADLLIERADTKVQFDLEQPVCHWPVVAALRWAHLTAATERIEEPELQVGRAGKRLARILELTLIGDGGGSQRRIRRDGEQQSSQ
ncbi:MAG: hypothetical protein EA418_10395 [Wenzhouxiangellaceae bacterium]|nr:MAG: hypothetical protein EA418_10395 [Wenzhouxiangellaceae bacterium]